jgi:hypothetical protein
MPDDLIPLLVAARELHNRQEHRFLLDVIRALHESPQVALAEMEALWHAAQMPRPPELVWQALVQMAALAWRAALATRPLT